MSWKKNFASSSHFAELPLLGAFKIVDEPEPLGKGQFRVIITLKNGTKKTFKTFESTIGDIVSIDSEWVEAYTETFGKGKDAKDYIRYRAWKE